VFGRSVLALTPLPAPEAIAFAPGRVNLMGDHTDYAGGLVLPMAIQLGTTVTFLADADTARIRFESDAEAEPADLPLEVAHPESVAPAWARYVAGVISEVAPSIGGAGRISTTLPIGSGLSSSAALEVAAALALGFTGSTLELAMACQRAEQRACGLPCGLMDQLTSVAGVPGCALLIDCRSNRVETVAIPEGCEIVAVHSGETRSLAGSEYARRRRDCEEAAAIVGHLADASPEDVASLRDDLLRRRARHVVMENQRVRDFAASLEAGDLEAAGTLMLASHASLRDDFEVSTPALDARVEDLRGQPGVFGARLTGAGFGGCVVALSAPGALDVGWPLRPSAGARLRQRAGG
jgi:galactokinase